MQEIETNREIGFYSSKEDLKNNIKKNTYERSFNNFPDLKSEQVYAMVKTNAMDRYSALNKSYLKLVNIVKLNCIYKPNYNPLIRNQVLVYCNHGCWMRNNESKLLNIGMENNLFSFINKYIGKNKDEYNNNTLEAVRKALHWVRVANESPLESKFLSFWTALESLLTSYSNSKLSSILEYVPAFIGVYYPRRLVLEIWFALEKYISNMPEKYYKELEIHYDEKYEFDIISFCKLIMDECENFIENYESSDFVVRKLRWLQGSLNNNRLLLRKIKKIDIQVQNDMRRLYRLRNLLVHQAHIGEVDLSYMTKRVIFYLEVILNNISYALDQNPSHSLLELLISRKRTYDLLRDKLETQCYPDLDICDIIYPITVLSN